MDEWKHGRMEVWENGSMDEWEWLLWNEDLEIYIIMTGDTKLCD